MDATHIILKPMITEKSSWESSARNRYSFRVHPKASKHMIRDAIQQLYNVRVTAVATQNRMGKYRRTRSGLARTRNWKKAIVELHPDDRIDLF